MPRLQVPSQTGDSGALKADSASAADDSEALLPAGHGGSAVSGGVSVEQLFGAARLMNPTSGDPFYLGPVRSDYVFPLPDSQADTVRMACSASYRCVPISVTKIAARIAPAIDRPDRLPV